jgi:hypothetical protein
VPELWTLGLIRVRRFDLSDTWRADCSVSETLRVGEIYHVVQNSAGGTILTPIARFFVWRPTYMEGFNLHWRVDCFVRQHPLSPEPIPLGESLVDALVRECLCDGPIWMSAHTGRELEGKAYGDVFEQK